MPGSYLAIVRRWFWLVLACIALAGAVTFGVNARSAPTYQATATVLVHPLPGTTPITHAVTLDELAQTYAVLMTARPVLEQVITDLSLPYTPAELQGRMSVAQERGTLILDVTARDGNPGRAADIANTVIKDFLAQGQAFSQEEGVSLTAVQSATPPVSPIGPRTLRNTAVAAVGGGIFGLVLVLLIEYVLVALRPVADPEVARDRGGALPVRRPIDPPGRGPRHWGRQG